MIRAVLDVNVLVSAVFSRDGAPGRLISGWDEGQFELVTSPALIRELSAVLARPRIKKRAKTADTIHLLESLEQAALIVEDPVRRPTVRSADPDDDYLIALAMSQQAALVSGDRHLTDLRGTIPVFSPAEFLDYLAAA